MSEIKKLGEMGLNTLDSKSSSHISEIVVNDNRVTDAEEYYKLSTKSKKDLRETFPKIKNLNETEGRFAKIFNNYVLRFEEKAKPRGIGIIMSGNPGTGKTFFLTAYGMS